MERDGREGRRGRRRSMRGLVAAWAVYWIALAVAALWTPVTLFVRLKQRMPGRAALLFTDEHGLQVTLDKATVWAASVSTGECLAWLVGPPLVMWMAWLWWSARASARDTPARVAPRPEAAQLPPPDFAASPQVPRERRASSASPNSRQFDG